jgi:acetyltransferase-like isoleucine patch superfamily enzyme
MDECVFPDPRPVALSFATAPLIVFTRCRLAGVSGDSLQVTANLEIRESMITGPVVVSGGRIGGAFICSGSELGVNGSGISLTANGLNVRLSVQLTAGFRAAGAVNLPRAEIGGQLNLGGAELGANDNKDSIDGRGMTVAGSVYLDRGFSAQGAVRLSAARISGQLRCDSARIGADREGNSLIGDVVRVHGGVLLDPFEGGSAFIAAGAVVFTDSEVTGSFTCHDAQLGTNRSQLSLDCRGMRVSGSVRLDGRFDAKGAVWLAGANITGQLRCGGARIGANNFGNALIGDGLRAGGGIVLDALSGGRAFTALGAVRLTGAEVTGSLSCAGASFSANKQGNALEADEIRVSVAVLFHRGFVAAGAVRLARADIGGQLRCRGARITGADSDGDSMVAGGIRVGGPVLLDREFVTVGAIQLAGADVNGSVRLQGATVGANREGYSLDGSGMRVGGELLFDRAPDGTRFSSKGAIRLAAVSVTGSIRCQGAELNGWDKDGDSLVLNAAKVSGSVFLSNGFAAAGAATLARADIVGSVACGGARLGRNKERNSLIGDGLRVSRDVALNTDRDRVAFTASGAVRLTGADIVGQLRCQGAQLQGGDQDGDALFCNGVKVGDSVYLDQGFSAVGAVKFSRASIAGSFHCRGAHLGANNKGAALTAERMSVNGGVLLDEGFIADGAISLRGAAIVRELRWAPEKAPAAVNLESARVQQLTDDWTNGRPGGLWPKGTLRLAGLTYEGFGGDDPPSVELRLAWVRSQYEPPAGNPAASPGATPFIAQPYKQLADVYRRAGQDDEARLVEIARRRDLRRYGDIPAHRKILNWVLDVTIRYGFQTWRALAVLVGLYAVTFSAFLLAQHQPGLITPANTQAAAHGHPTALQCVTSYPCFYPAGYAVDIVFPLINLHQAENWRADGQHSWGWAWVAGTWAATGLGWSLATLVVVGYTGLARRE